MILAKALIILTLLNDLKGYLSLKRVESNFESPFYFSFSDIIPSKGATLSEIEAESSTKSYDSDFTDNFDIKTETDFAALSSKTEVSQQHVVHCFLKHLNKFNLLFFIKFTHFLALFLYFINLF